MKRLAIFIGLILVLCSYSSAFGERVKITIESYANPSLSTKSTIVETTDPYDQNDTGDQLEMAHQAMLFALSSDGWDLTAEGFYTTTVAACGGGQWHTGVTGYTFSDDPDYYQTLLGYEVNSEALNIIGQYPQNQAMGLAFNTNVWCPLQGAHDFCESENNYGVISGLMAGIFMQCAVPEWGRFTVEVVPEVIETRVSSSSDDAEERALRMYLDSSDLDLIFDDDKEIIQTVGIRFNGVNIPQGAHILNAYVQFQVEEASSEPTLLKIAGEATDDAATFTATPYDISSRSKTDAVLPWSPVPWVTVGEAGPDQRTPDISAIIREIVDRPGWSSGNSLAMIITGTGRRVAESYDGEPDGAPLLHVEYILPGTVWRVKTGRNDPTDCSGGDSWATAFGSIQKAIDCASAGDEIWVRTGTYYPGINVNKLVALYGGFAGSESERHQRDWEAYVTIVDGGNRENCFTVTADAIINGFLITRGDGVLGGLFGSSVGGGVYIPGSSSLTLANCTVSSNDGDEVLGGGIYSGPNSSSTIIGCQFLNNMAEGDGSAIFSIGSFLTIINSSFSGNKAYFGGGTVRGGGSLIVAGSTFTSNHVYGGGGAINGGGNMIVTDSIFIGNGAFRGSGAISYGGSIDSRGHISDCTFSENGGQEGGAIELWTDGFFLISNCTFTNNRTSLGGGAIRVQRGQPRIENCIFSGNDSGDGCGGAIFNTASAAPIIVNCTFLGNDAPWWGGGAICSEGSASPTIINSILWDNRPDQMSGGNPIISYSNIDQDGFAGTNGNIRQDPLLVNPGYWDDNGTPSDEEDDFWVDGDDYHLQATSPCIDAGTDTALALPLTDFEGDNRIIGSAPDMGADEAPCAVSTYYKDADGDGYGNPDQSTPAPQDCSQPTGYVEDNTDCDDNDPNEHHGQTWYKDSDNDGYSDGTTNTTSCTRPSEYKVQSELSATSGDCNDNDPEVNPGATEVCNDKDDNCDGTVDEGFDVDKDGYKTCEGDCDDSEPSIHPGATEVCNGKDDDCDGGIDEGVQTTYFRDADGDGYGDPNNWTKACSQPAGYALNDLDCDDTDPNEHPNQVWYKDADSDGYSDGSTNTLSCTRPIGFKVESELIATSGDCDDTDQNRYPGAPEACNGKDDDCDGEIDEGCVFNNPPEASAGPDRTVMEGNTITLDGSNSSDPDPEDSIVSYKWTQLGGIPVMLSDPAAVKPKFVTPAVMPGGMILTFNLMVKDEGNSQDNDQVTITVNDNGITGFPDDVLTMKCSTGMYIGIKVESGGDCTSINIVDPAYIPDSPDKPENLPYGLFDIQIKTKNPGDTVKATFYLETPAGSNYTWFKYKNSTDEWEDYSANTSFNAARDQVTVTWVDGGDGDEGPEDGWVLDPSGLGSTPTVTTGGGGGGGCFIDTATDS